MSSFSTSTKGSDEFTSGVSDFFGSIAKHSKALIALAVLILLGAAVAVFVMNKKEEKVDAGRNALFLAEKNLDGQMKKMSEASVPAAKTPSESKDSKVTKAPKADPEAMNYSVFDVDAKLGDTVKQLQAITQDYPGTRPAFESMMLLGKLYLDHGQASHAQEWFKKATEIPPSSLDKALAWSGVGYSYENDGKYKEAIDAFDHALNQGEGVIKGDAMMSKARSYQALKDTNQAKATYDQIISQLPETEYAKTAQASKARLQ
jgi:TolA-binding protein